MHPAEEVLDIRQDLLALRVWLQDAALRQRWVNENIRAGIAPTQTRREIGNQQVCHQILQAAAPIWASGSVVEGLRSAVESYPLSAMFHRCDLWRLHGFLWSEAPLFTVRTRLERVAIGDTRPSRESVVNAPVHGLVWGLYAELPRTFDPAMGTVRLGIDGSKPHTLALHAVCRDLKHGVAFPALHFYLTEGQTLRAGLDEGLHHDLRGDDATDSAFPAEAEALLRWWIVLQHFLREQLLVTTPQTPNRHQRKRLERAGQPVSDVQVVSLRKVQPAPPSEPVPGETPDERARREYHCRWWVQGHWRQQWYPAAQQHRPKWIDLYDKGPEGLPFRERRKVHAAVR